MSEKLTTTELGLHVPEKPGEGYRKHTAERWKERDPTSYHMCIAMVRSGVLNQLELKRLVDANRKERGIAEEISRNCINALMLSSEFSENEILELTRKKALIVRSQGVDKTGELIDAATSPKDVGGVAMATKLMSDIVQVMSDRPTSIVEERQVLRVEDFNASVEELNRRALAAAGPVYEAEIIPQKESVSNKESNEA
jgi:hypothetical protein